MHGNLHANLGNTGVQLSTRLKDRSGQGLVEFALVALLLMIIILGGVSMIEGFVARLVTSNAARDAARVAAIDCGDGGNVSADVQTAAYDDLKGGGQQVAGSSNPGAMNISSASPGEWYVSAQSCPAQGQLETVEVWYAAPDLFPAILHTLGVQYSNAFDINASATFPVE